ncbi:uncharacterized protein BXZ73DRAFT_96029 [Epithele typhae]|uniref:uncharacterized protein n=1 Tax=Epithele typhae TaxID=378194 RepID=UPI002007B038|nr:uncharacterized protein BXZ73DRAFT_96029 [Epithele typhae]KAH9945042.1 hypothetical protein BXZ73DRAFT_96029 [Epithele typhae]
MSQSSPCLLISRVPEEVLVGICLECEPCDVFALGKACSFLHRILSRNVYVQYKLELALAGMLDQPLPPCAFAPCAPAFRPSTLGTAAKLHLLRLHRARAHSGRFAPATPVAVARGPHVARWDAYPAFGGALAAVVVRPDHADALVVAPPLPPMLAFGPDGSIIVAGTRAGAGARACASESADGTSGRGVVSWTVPLDAVPMGSARPCVIATDITQNLLVFVQTIEDGAGQSENADAIAYIRCLDRAEATHPRTLCPAIRIAPQDQTAGNTGTPPFWPRRRRVNKDIQIHGLLIAWSIASDNHTSLSERVTFEIWNWATGALVNTSVPRPVSYFPTKRQFHGLGFSSTLLDCSTVLVSSFLWDDEMRVYRFQHPPDSEADPEPGGLAPGEHIALKLPPHAHCATIQQSSIPAPPPCAPFWPDPARRILALHLTQAAWRPATLLLPAAVLCALVRRGAAAVPWDAWGARGSVVLPVRRARVRGDAGAPGGGVTEIDLNPVHETRKPQWALGTLSLVAPWSRLCVDEAGGGGGKADEREKEKAEPPGWEIRNADTAPPHSVHHTEHGLPFPRRALNAVLSSPEGYLAVEMGTGPQTDQLFLASDLWLAT